MATYQPPPFSPRALDLPYDSYREPYQWDAVYKALSSPQPFVGICAPTGCGKTLAILSLAQMLKATGRVAILTSTKAHQDQLEADYRHVKGVVDIRGHNAYSCNPKKLPDGTWQCEMKIHCPYQMQRELASKAPIIITNYAFWVADRIYSPKPVSTGVTTLICDESHLTFNDVANALTLNLSRVLFRTGEFWPETVFETATEWREHLGVIRVEAYDSMLALEDKAENEKILSGKASEDTLRGVRRYQGIVKICDLAVELHVGDDNWVVEKEGEGVTVSLTPVWIHSLAKEFLYGTGIGKTIFLSATLTQKTVAQLGVDSNFLDFYSYPSIFPESRRPFYYVPTVRLNNKSTGADYNLLIARIDEILRQRLDRKGLIHSVSYARSEYIANRSFHREYMVTHGRGGVVEAVNTFKMSLPPAILLSPSISHGFDFPAKDAEYCILSKLPYPDGRSELMKRRAKDDDEYLSNIAMQSVVQQAGRAMRAVDEQAESFMLDMNWGWFYKKYYHLAPTWFVSRYEERVPAPPPPL